MSVKLVGDGSHPLTVAQSDLLQTYRHRMADTTALFFDEAQAEMTVGLAGSAAVSALVEQVAVIFVNLERVGIAKPQEQFEQNMLAGLQAGIARERDANRRSAS